MTKRAPYPVREPWPGSPQYWQSLEGRAALGDPALSDRDAPEFPKGYIETPPTDEAQLVSRRGEATGHGRGLGIGERLTGLVLGGHLGRGALLAGVH